jgi:hypothetical protein
VTPFPVPALLRAIISDVFSTSGDLPARWVDVCNRMLNCFGVEYFQQHQSDYWTDLILRKVEDEAVVLLAQQSENQPVDSLPTFQISLSRMWVLSTYEGVRLAHETAAGRNNAKLAELRRRLEMVRVPLAKQEIANDQKIKDAITLVRVGPPKEAAFLIERIGALEQGAPLLSGAQREHVMSMRNKIEAELAEAVRARVPPHLLHRQQALYA